MGEGEPTKFYKNLTAGHMGKAKINMCCDDFTERRAAFMN